MSSFIRFAGATALVLSLGLFVSALPLVYANLKVAVGTDAVSCSFKKMIIDLALDAKIKALLVCGSIEELEVAVVALVTLFKGCTDDLVKLGAGVVIDANAKLSLVACVASIITLLVQVLVQVCLKFGIAATVHICAQIDVAIRALLVALNICVDGILVLVVQALATVIVTLCAQVKLDLCLALFSKVSATVA
ncbi:hypothetical protein RHS03_01692, partial [Rhizoctonia solani]